MIVSWRGVEGIIGRILENLRYAEAKVRSWEQDNEGNFIVHCEMKGTVQWFYMTKKQAESHIGLKIERE